VEKRILKNILVILDDSPGSRKAAYMAYEVAARLGARLVGAALFASQSQQKAEQNLRDFEVGARAAAVNVSGDYFPSLADALLAFNNLPIDAVFSGRDSLVDDDLLSDWWTQASCPLWIVPSQRQISRLLAVYDGSPGAAAALALALNLSSRWKVNLKLLVTAQGVLLDELLPEQGRQSAQIMLELAPGSDVAAILRQVAADNVDLVFLGRPATQEALRATMRQAQGLLAICPALNSS
jgi:nucleotide-binding universal stress UspA family protein